MDFNNDDNKEVISRLKLIGKLSKGDKLNVKSMIIQPTGIVTSISRTLFYQDNRTNTLNFVRNTINRVFEIIYTYSNTYKESDIFLCKHLVHDLKLAKNGITNLKETYLNDIKFCCDLDIVLENIESHLLDIEQNSIKVQKQNDEFNNSPKIANSLGDDLLNGGLSFKINRSPNINIPNIRSNNIKNNSDED
jgi:hypothetical protein